MYKVVTELNRHGNKYVRSIRATLIIVGLFAFATFANAQSLRGSRSSMDRQHHEAVSSGFSFLRTSQEVHQFVQNGYLVAVNSGGALELHDVSYPYARPAVNLFLQRLSQQYRNACGENLTVTSLTRPINKQPSNASHASVHPAGMAVDLRVPGNGRCRTWLESTLLSLERSGVLDATRERNPPHYHIAVYTGAYENYVARLQGNSSEYVVRQGDSLYEIAARNNTTLDALKFANNLTGNTILVGQSLTIPASDNRSVATASSSATTSSSAPDTSSSQVASAGNTIATQTSHTVRRGDSLFTIAQRNGTSVNAIRALNGLQSDVIQPGQKLKIPGNTNGLTASIDKLEHKVRRGESLWTIARRYSTTVSLLRSENGLRNDILRVGQVLIIRI